MAVPATSLLALVGETFHQVALNKTQYPEGPLLFEKITSVLLAESFAPETAAVSRFLTIAMPIMYQKLTSPSVDTKTLKIAIDAARQAKFHEIHDLQRDKEPRLVFEAAFTVLVYVLYVRGDPNVLAMDAADENTIKFYGTYEDINQQYGYSDSFPLQGIDPLEERKLLQFANWMQIAVLLLANKKKLNHMLDLVTRVSEFRRIKKYVTGSKQSPHTSRRVAIFRHEAGDLPIIPRPKRLKEIFNKGEDSEWLAEIGDFLDETFPDAERQVTEHTEYPVDNPNMKVNVCEIFYPRNHFLVRAQSYQVKQSELGEYGEAHVSINVSHVRQPGDAEDLDVEALFEALTMLDPQNDFHADLASVALEQKKAPDGSVRRVVSINRQLSQATAPVATGGAFAAAVLGSDLPQPATMPIADNDPLLLLKLMELERYMKAPHPPPGEGGGGDADPVANYLEQDIARCRSLSTFTWRSTDLRGESLSGATAAAASSSLTAGGEDTAQQPPRKYQRTTDT